MTGKPSPPASPPPEILDQALDLLLKAMEQGQPGDETSEYRESRVTHLDRLAWYHQVAGDALQMAARKRATLLRRQRNAIIPINRIPSELLSAILIETVDETQPRRIKEFQRLARVAWQWWQTIKSDPQVWTQITPPMEAAELQIRKAGNLPLRLHWMNDGDGTDDGNGTDDGDGTDDEDDRDDEDYTDWDDLGELVQRHATRWTGIELERFGGEEACLEALCTDHFPRLKYLRVHLSDDPDMMSENWRLNLAQCQNLQEARLPIMPYLPVTPSPNHPILLRTLHLDLRSMDSCSSQDLESVLRLAPQLVKLKVENLLRDTNHPASFGAPIIDLPNLRSLKFTNAATGDERECIPLLAQIRAPQLEKLGLRYMSESRGRRFPTNIDGRVVFTVLATWPSASTNRPEDAPLYSVLRRVGLSAEWIVTIWELGIRVSAERFGSGRLDIIVDYRYSSENQLPEDILTYLTPFGLSVELHVLFREGEAVEPGFWDGVLDATPSLRTFRVVSSVEIGRQVIDRLSTKAPSSSSANPRAPHLEKLTFELGGAGPGIWPKGDVEDAVKIMLDKRRELFIQGGVIDPPKLVVTGPR